MLLSLALARINALMTDATIEHIHAAAGTHLAVGTKLLDLKVDLSDTVAQDCPPVSYYRFVLREAAWLRHWTIEPRDKPAVGAVLAIFSTTADEPVDGAPARAIRIMTAGIVPDLQQVSGGAP